MSKVGYIIKKIIDGEIIPGISLYPVGESGNKKILIYIANQIICTIYNAAEENIKYQIDRQVLFKHVGKNFLLKIYYNKVQGFCLCELYLLCLNHGITEKIYEMVPKR